MSMPIARIPLKAKIVLVCVTVSYSRERQDRVFGKIYRKIKCFFSHHYLKNLQCKQLLSVR